MTTVSDVISFLNTIAPPELAESWDHTGFQLGSPNTEVTKILVALDPFEDVCEEAAQWSAQLLVTHHPLLFTPTVRITDETPVGRCIGLLMRNQISQWSGHTNLDIASGGVNDLLAEKLGLQGVEPLLPQHLLRVGTIPVQSLEGFLFTVKSALGCPGLRYSDGGKPCCRIAVGGGACASEIRDVLRAGCDTFVTSDVKYNQFWDSADLGISIIDAGHFYTENPICGYLASKLTERFPDISVRISQNHRDCMKFY